jgi:hypothetical protein
MFLSLDIYYSSIKIDVTSGNVGASLADALLSSA